MAGKTSAQEGLVFVLYVRSYLTKSGENLGYWVGRTWELLTPEKGVYLAGGDQCDPIQRSQV